MEAVCQRLIDQRVIRDFAPARYVLGAGQLIGKHHGQQILGVAALKLGRCFFAVAVAPDGESGRSHPAEASRKHRCVQQSLGQYVPDTSGLQIVNHLSQRETVGRSQGQDDAVLQCSGLEFKIEFAAELFSDRESPGAIHA